MEVSERDVPNGHETRNDLVAGWLGGAIGILVSNPFEVLKVRLQTTRVPSSRVGAGSRSTPPNPSTNHPSPLSKFTPNLPSPKPPPLVPSPNFLSLYRAEGLRFLFAGAAGPIIGLAFIDSAFFGGYGRAMQLLEQDRNDPARLSRVFLAGAASGAGCALLQTPIEVVKCRAQAESLSPDGKKLGSFKIAKKIAQEGLRGFYIGGLMTACRDGISSGIFFWGYFVFRRVLRGEEAFLPSRATTSSILPAKPAKVDTQEILRMLLAGGLAGSLSAVIPYPLDIIKTRLQTSNIHPHPSATPHPRLTARQVAHEIHQDGRRLPISPNSVMRLLPKRILGLRGFLQGIRPTVVSSFVGSGVTITVFELALMALGGRGEG